MQGGGDGAGARGQERRDEREMMRCLGKDGSGLEREGDGRRDEMEWAGRSVWERWRGMWVCDGEREREMRGKKSRDGSARDEGGRVLRWEESSGREL
ncbi:hypothetical protein AAC387_Pa04g0468 [Persea americana]